MKHLGVGSLYVLDSDRKFKGLIKLDEVSELAKKVPEHEDEHRTIEPVLHKEYYQPSPMWPLPNSLEESARNVVPLAVIDDDGVFLGIVTRPAILSGIAG